MSSPDKQILVVEDDETLRAMIVMVLEDEGYQVKAAENGLVAQDIISAGAPSLLITDLYMPKMNGVELIKWCKVTHPEVKMILISGGGKDVDAEHGGSRVVFNGEGLEVDMFLKKPCDMLEMFAIIEKLTG